MTEGLHPRLSCRCIEDKGKNCTTSCRKYMRGECDGAPGGMLDAGGVWMENTILRELRRGGFKLTLDPGNLPPGVGLAPAKLLTPEGLIELALATSKPEDKDEEGQAQERG